MKLTFNLIITMLLLFSTSVMSQSGSVNLFHSLDEIAAILDSLRIEYPQIISEKESIGQSVEGRDIWAVKISDNPDEDEDEPQILYNSLIHGTEPMSMMVLLKFMNYILENYDSDTEINYLVNNRELFFVPVINPDGYILRQRKNRRDNGDGSFGVDLNRNFGYMWDSSTDSLNLETTSHMYRGPAPFSEPESNAIKDFCQRHNFAIANNMHYFGYWIYYPWAYNLTQTEDSSRFNNIASIGTEINNYLHRLPFSAVPGSALDWMYSDQPGKPGIYSFITEVGDSSQTDILNPTAEEIERIGVQNLYLNKIFAWGPGIIEELPVIENLNISERFLMPDSDTLLITAEEKSNAGRTSVRAYIIDEENEEIDSVNLAGMIKNEKRYLTGKWIAGNNEKNYHLVLEQTGEDKPFKFIYKSGLRNCRFTTIGPVKINIEEILPHSFRDYKIKLSITNYGKHAAAENLMVLVAGADTSVTSFSPEEIIINRIDPGEAEAIYRYIYVDVDEKFNDRFNFDFEIYSNGVLYWKDSVSEYPVGLQDDEHYAVNEYRLGQNFPNPFNPETVITYSIAKEGLVTLRVYDILGNTISTLVNEYQQSGSYDIIFNSNRLTDAGNYIASGLYIYTLRINGYIESRKMLLLK